jgi:TPR repeat protein
MVATGWYRLAASNGYTKSQYALAKAFSNGNNVKKNYVRALHWYTKAAKQGHRKAAY